MKWIDSRVPACFQCRNFIGWPYCRFYPDGIPEDIQYGGNDRCQQFRAAPAQNVGILQRLRDMLQKGGNANRDNRR